MSRLQRSEGNILSNVGCCIPFLVIIFIATTWAIGFTGSDSGAVIALPLFFVFGALYLWIPSKLFKDRWYLEDNDEGITYSIFFVKRKYPWHEIDEVSTEKSPGFTGRYDDSLVLMTKEGVVKFFLPDFDLHSKKETVAYTDSIKERHRSLT
jgi:hypothetical protein